MLASTSVARSDMNHAQFIETDWLYQICSGEGLDTDGTTVGRVFSEHLKKTANPIENV